MEYIFMRFPEGKSKAVTLSYDDGSCSDVQLAEILNKYNLKCTFNLCSEIVKNGKSLKKEEIKKFLIDNGHEIAVHGANHRAQGSQRSFAGIRDVLDCRLYLEENFGQLVRGMAYPDTGVRHIESVTSYEEIKNYLKSLGIVYARTLGRDNDDFALPEDWYAWMPTAHHENEKLFDYVKKFVDLKIDDLYKSRRFPRLFFLWGHSNEFSRSNNWNIIEHFCEEIGGKADTWYATNIEIYNYVNAYNSLIFSADETIVYNPTVITIWFNVDGKTYSVKSGETITIFN